MHIQTMSSADARQTTKILLHVESLAVMTKRSCMLKKSKRLRLPRETCISQGLRMQDAKERDHIIASSVK